MEVWQSVMQFAKVLAFYMRCLRWLIAECVKCHPSHKSLSTSSVEMCNHSSLLGNPCTIDPWLYTSSDFLSLNVLGITEYACSLALAMHAGKHTQRVMLGRGQFLASSQPWSGFQGALCSRVKLASAQGTGGTATTWLMRTSRALRGNVQHACASTRGLSCSLCSRGSSVTLATSGAPSKPPPTGPTLTQLAWQLVPSFCMPYYAWRVMSYSSCGRGLTSLENHACRSASSKSLTAVKVRLLTQAAMGHGNQR